MTEKPIADKILAESELEQLCAEDAGLAGSID